MDNLQLIKKRDEELRRVSQSTFSLPETKISDYYKGLKVAALIGDENACGYYRVIFPLHMLKLHGAEISASTTSDFGALRDADIVIFPRQHDPQIYEFFRQLGWDNKILIYELDDDLHSVEPNNPAYRVYHLGTQEWKMIPHFMKFAHGLTVTTSEIAKRYYKYNQNIAMIPNFIDFSFRNWHCDVTWDGIQPSIIPKPIPRPEEYGKDIIIQYQGGACYDKETEILTENGWKLFQDLKDGEKVATLDSLTNEIEYQVPTNYIKEKFEGNLMCAKSRQIDYAVTPNHKMFLSIAQNRTNKLLNFERKEIQNVYGKLFHCKKNGIWKGNDHKTFVLPSVSINNQTCEPKFIPYEEWVKFLGFWYAKGWTATTKNLYQVGICQFKSNDILEEMKLLLEKWEFNPSYNKNKTTLRISNKQLWSYLSQFGKALDKFIDRNILELNKEYLETFLEYFIKGDGHIEYYTYKGDTVPTPKRTCYTSSKRLADDLSEIAFKIGLAANIHTRFRQNGSTLSNGQVIESRNCSYEVNILEDSQRNFLNPAITSANQYTLPYNDYVYCVEVPNHIIYVRRNGKTMWCGNSHIDDVKVMGSDIASILKKYANVKFSMYSNFQLVEDFIQEFDLPRDKVLIMESKHFLDHPSGMFGCDIQLAPIVANQFNLSKSNLKVLEAGAAGCAVIASNVGPYSQFNADYPDTILTVGKGEGNFPSWKEAMEYLIENPSTLEHLKEKTRNTIINNFSLEANFHRWPNSWKSIWSNCLRGECGPPEEDNAKKVTLTYGKVGRNDPCPCGSRKKYKVCCLGAFG